MATKITSESGWELSPSYDIGVGYTYRNILANNPIRQRFFKQWLARIDNENIKGYYDYETGKALASSPQGPTEIFYDQIQRMVYSAQLPSEIELEIFDHLDYISTGNTIDFLRVKEFFAFCGIDGVYDLENRKHSQMVFDPPFVVEHLKFEEWAEKDRLLATRMMAESGEVPNNTKKIQELKNQRELIYHEQFVESETGKRFDALVEKVYGPKTTPPEDWAKNAEQARLNNITLDDNDEELKAFNEEFDASPESQAILNEIADLKRDEEEKLAIAADKYFSREFLADPSAFHAMDEGIGRYGRKWARETERLMRHADHWSDVFNNGHTHKSYSNEPPTEEELPNLAPELVDQGYYSYARFDYKERLFKENHWQSVVYRYCAIQDWILREYTMSDINRGELARVRKIDIPILFAQALRDEMEDGLLNRLKFPIRVEPVDDGTGNYYLVLNNEKVEIFHPDEVLYMADHDRQLPQDQLNDQSATQNNVAEQEQSSPEPNDDFLDFKIHAPSRNASANPEEDTAAIPLGSPSDTTPQGQPGAVDEDPDQALRDKGNAVGRDARQFKEKGPQGSSLDAKLNALSPEEKKELADRIKASKGNKEQMEAEQAAAAMRSRGGGGWPGIGFNYQGKIVHKHHDDPALKELASARTELGEDSGDLSRWKRLKRSLSRLKSGVDQMSESPNQDKIAFRDRLMKIGREMKKTMGMMDDFIRNNPAIGKIAERCREMVAKITKTVVDMLKLIQRMFGIGSQPATP